MLVGLTGQGHPYKATAPEFESTQNITHIMKSIQKYKGLVICI